MGIAFDLFGDYKNYVIPVNELTDENLQEKYDYIQSNYKEIKKILEEKSVIYKEKADNQINELIEKLEGLESKYVTNRSLCTGCMACYNSCPQKAITKKEEDGFIYPEIDHNKCVDCNICRKVCPINKNYKKEENEKKC